MPLGGFCYHALNAAIAWPKSSTPPTPTPSSGCSPKPPPAGQLPHGQPTETSGNAPPQMSRLGLAVDMFDGHACVGKEVVENTNVRSGLECFASILP